MYKKCQYWSKCLINTTKISILLVPGAKTKYYISIAHRVSICAPISTGCPKLCIQNPKIKMTTKQWTVVYGYFNPLKYTFGHAAIVSYLCLCLIDYRQMAIGHIFISLPLSHWLQANGHRPHIHKFAFVSLTTGKWPSATYS